MRDYPVEFHACFHCHWNVKRSKVKHYLKIVYEQRKTHKDKQTKDQKNFENRPTKYYKEKQIKILQTDITQKQIQGKNKQT